MNFPSLDLSKLLFIKQFYSRARFFVGILPVTIAERNQRVPCSMLRIITLFDGISKSLNYTKLGNSNKSTIWEITVSQLSIQLSDIVLHTLLIWFRLENVSFKLILHAQHQNCIGCYFTISGQQIELVICTSKLWGTSDFKTILWKFDTLNFSSEFCEAFYSYTKTQTSMKILENSYFVNEAVKKRQPQSCWL